MEINMGVIKKQKLIGPFVLGTSYSKGDVVYDGQIAYTARVDNSDISLTSKFTWDKLTGFTASDLQGMVNLANSLDSDSEMLNMITEGLPSDFYNHIDKSTKDPGVTKDNIGLSKINNTSDMEKPMSNAIKNYINNLFGGNNHLNASITTLWEGYEASKWGIIESTSSIDTNLFKPIVFLIEYTNPQNMEDIELIDFNFKDSQKNKVITSLSLDDKTGLIRDRNSLKFTMSRVTNDNINYGFKLEIKINLNNGSYNDLIAIKRVSILKVSK